MGDGGGPFWGAVSYIKNKIPVVEDFSCLSKYRSRILFPRDYNPDLKNTKLFNDEGVSMYHSSMGILIWYVELGRIYLCLVEALMK